MSIRQELTGHQYRAPDMPIYHYQFLTILVVDRRSAWQLNLLSYAELNFQAVSYG